MNRFHSWHSGSHECEVSTWWSKTWPVGCMQPNRLFVVVPESLAAAPYPGSFSVSLLHNSTFSFGEQCGRKIKKHRDCHYLCPKPDGTTSVTPNMEVILITSPPNTSGLWHSEGHTRVCPYTLHSTPKLDCPGLVANMNRKADYSHPEHNVKWHAFFEYQVGETWHLLIPCTLRGSKKMAGRNYLLVSRKAH